MTDTKRAAAAGGGWRPSRDSIRGGLGARGGVDPSTSTATRKPATSPSTTTGSAPDSVSAPTGSMRTMRPGESGTTAPTTTCGPSRPDCTPRKTGTPTAPAACRSMPSCSGRCGRRAMTPPGSGRAPRCPRRSSTPTWQQPCLTTTATPSASHGSTWDTTATCSTRSTESPTGNRHPFPATSTFATMTATSPARTDRQKVARSSTPSSRASCACSRPRTSPRSSNSSIATASGATRTPRSTT